MSKLEEIQNKAVLAMFDTQINTIEDLLSGIADCEYQTINTRSVGSYFTQSLKMVIFKARVQ